MGYVSTWHAEDSTRRANRTVGAKLSVAELAFVDQERVKVKATTETMDRSRTTWGTLSRSAFLRLLVQAEMNPSGDAARTLKKLRKPVAKPVARKKGETP